MVKIEIDIDTEKKGITGLKLPTELNPVEITMILNSVQNKILSGLKINVEKDTKVIQPYKKIKLV